MIDTITIGTVMEVVEYLGDFNNAFGIWIAATGILAGAHLIAPLYL